MDVPNPTTTMISEEQNFYLLYTPRLQHIPIHRHGRFLRGTDGTRISSTEAASSYLCLPASIYLVLRHVICIHIQTGLIFEVVM